MAASADLAASGLVAAALVLFLAFVEYLRRLRRLARHAGSAQRARLRPSPIEVRAIGYYRSKTVVLERARSEHGAERPPGESLPPLELLECERCGTFNVVGDVQ